MDILIEDDRGLAMRPRLKCGFTKATTWPGLSVESAPRHHLVKEMKDTSTVARSPS